MQPPVFIVGALRSGTTLLRLMVDHHPEICIFGEFEYAVRWIEDGKPPPIREYHRLLDSDRVFRAHGLRIDPSLGYRALVQSFLEQASAPSGKPIAGAAIHSNFHELPQLFPDARYVHLLRDPRDVSRSCIGMGWVGNVYYGTRYWMEAVGRWKRLEPALDPSQKHQLKYEDLIRDPEGELRKICDFVGVNFDSAMLEYPDDSTYRAPDVALVEQWRTKLSDDEVRWVESICGPLMREVGYEPQYPAATGPTAIQRLKLALQNRTSRVQRNLDVYGFPLYVSWQLSKRLPSNPLQKRVLRRVQDIDQQRLK
jgi:hypothetical protein